MICGNCKNTLPDGAAFCPFCGKTVEASAIARSAMAGEEEYAGRYATGNMPEPEIRFSGNLRGKTEESAQQSAPASPAAPVEVEQPAPVAPAAPVEVEQPAPVAPAAPIEVERPISVAPPVPTVVEQLAPVVPAVEQKFCACGAPLRDGAKFCNYCGAPVVEAAEPVAPLVMEEALTTIVPPEEELRFVPPVVEEPAPIAPPVVEEPAPIAPPVVEEPAPIVPPMVEEPVVLPAVENELKCPACGAALKEDAMFCANCGQKQVTREASVDVNAPAPNTQVAVAQSGFAQQPKPAVKKCPLCGAIVPAEATSCSGCGVAFRVQTPVVPAAPAANAPKAAKKKFNVVPLVVGIIALLAIVGVAVAGFLLGWFDFDHPLTDLYNAVDKTLASSGYNAELTISAGDTKINGTVDSTFDAEKEDLSCFIELHAEGETLTIAFRDGIGAIQVPGQSAYKIDMEEEFEDLFGEAEGSESFEDALEEIVEVILEKTGMEDAVDQEKVVACIQDSVNSVSWLKENAGLTIKNEDGMKLYVLTPKLGDLVIAFFKEIEPAFKDADDFSELIKDLKESREDMNEAAVLEIAFGIKGGKLVKLELDVEAQENHIKMEIEFENIGKAEVDIDAIEEFIEDATEAGSLPTIIE